MPSHPQYGSGSVGQRMGRRVQVPITSWQVALEHHSSRWQSSFVAHSRTCGPDPGPPPSACPPSGGDSAVAKTMFSVAQAGAELRAISAIHVALIAVPLVSGRAVAP